MYIQLLKKKFMILPIITIFPLSLTKGSIFSVKLTVPKKFVYNVVFATFSSKASPLNAVPALFTTISIF